MIVSLALLLSNAASGANLTDVRVGVHQDYTRVVFQLDGVSPYRLVGLQPKEDGSQVLIVALDAAPAELAPIRSAKSRHIEVVRVRASDAGQADVRIRLTGDAEMKELVLRTPDRIVFDFFDAGAGKASLVSALAAATPVVEEPVRESAEMAAVTEELASESTESTETPEDAEPVEGVAVEEAAPPGGMAGASDEVFDEAAEPEEAVEPLEGELLAAVPELQEPVAPPEDAFAGVEIGEVVREEEAAGMPAETSPPPLDLPGDESGRSLLGSPVVYTGLVGLAVVALLFVLGRRRKGDEAEDLSPLDVAEETDPDAGFAFADGREGESAAEAEPAPAGEYDIEPGAVSVGEPAVEEEAPVDQDMDYPAPAGLGGQAPTHAPLATVGPNDVGSSEVAKLVEEFERRIAHLENRLEEVVDVKERLERQVSAQTEELRVQRAAIARTQRVLRTIARPEDEASEPAPKL